MIKISVLGSGSSGNATLITDGRTRILVDAGLSARQICLRMEEIGADPDSVDAIVITHEHGDHISGLDVFCKTRRIPIFCTRMTHECLKDSLKLGKRWNLFEPGTAFEIGGIAVIGFKVPHDAVDPVGFAFEDQDSRVGVVSDIGHVTHTVRDRLMGCDTLFIEANYDETMLAEDQKRPWSTKQRIASRHGHLSNSQSAAAAVALASCGRLRRVILGHLSGDCNEPQRAQKTVSSALHDAGHPHVHVHCAMQKSPTPLVDAAPPRPDLAPPITPVSLPSATRISPAKSAPPPSSARSSGLGHRSLSEYVQVDLF